MRKIDILKTCMIALGLLLLQSCSEIEHGVNDIDSWPEIIDIETPEEFIHPGILHTQEDIERIKEIVKSGTGPAYESYLEFSNLGFSKSDYKIEGPFETISRDDDGRLYERDFNAACNNAIMYALTGVESHAQKAAEILKAYAGTLKTIDTSVKGEAPLLAGIMGIKFVYAAEVIRYLYPQGMNDEDFAKVCSMFKNVFKPVLDLFYETPPYTNGNWGAGVTMTYIAIAVLTDDKEMYKKAVDFYTMGNDNGSLMNYIDGETGQCQESGRDQQHVQLGLECLAKTCEVAWKQGTDLYGIYENRLLKGYEYTAKYNLGYDDVPFKQWTDVTGKYCKWTVISQETKNANNGVDTRRGEFRPVFEMVYNHYYGRKGLSMPYTKAVIDQISPEGYYYEHFGFGTLLFKEWE